MSIPQRRSPLIRFWFDQVVAGRVRAGRRILWHAGVADQEWRTVQSAVGDAEAIADPPRCVTPCPTALPAALWVGNLAAAGRYAEMLLDHSRKHGFARGMISPARLKGVVTRQDRGSRRGRHCCAPASTRSPIPTRPSGSDGLVRWQKPWAMWGGFATDWHVERGSTSQRGWLTPELLRIKGEPSFAAGTTEPQKPGGGLLPASARRGATATDVVLGAAR